GARPRASMRLSFPYAARKSASMRRREPAGAVPAPSNSARIWRLVTWPIALPAFHRSLPAGMVVALSHSPLAYAKKSSPARTLESTPPWDAAARAWAGEREGEPSDADSRVNSAAVVRTQVDATGHSREIGRPEPMENRARNRPLGET